MSTKKLILQLEKFFKQKFHDLDAGFYVNERCVYIWDLRNQFFLIPIIRK